MLGNIGMPELLVIFLFILIFFGSKKIPEIAKGLGQGMREFRKAMKDIEETVHHPSAELLDETSTRTGSFPPAASPEQPADIKKNA